MSAKKQKIDLLLKNFEISKQKIEGFKSPFFQEKFLIGDFLIRPTSN